MYLNSRKHLRFIVGDDNEIDFYLGIFILENIAKQTERSLCWQNVFQGETEGETSGAFCIYIFFTPKINEKVLIDSVDYSGSCFCLGTSEAST